MEIPSTFPRGTDAPHDEADAVVEAYQPPLVERLGSLAELTLGGWGDVDDGVGGAGDEGSV